MSEKWARGEWIPFHVSLRKGAKRGLARATRFIYLELSMEARRYGGQLPLPRGFKTDVDAVHDILGGDRREIARALTELTAKLDPSDPADEPMISLNGPSDRRILVITSHHVWVKQDLSTQRVRDLRKRRSEEIHIDVPTGNAFHHPHETVCETPQRREEKRKEEPPKVPRGGQDLGLKTVPVPAPEPAEDIAAKVTAEDRYAHAYADGQTEASREPYPPPTIPWERGAINRFTQTEGWGKGLRGEELLAAIRSWSRDYRRAKDEKSQFERGFAPSKCEEWARGRGWKYRPAKPRHGPKAGLAAPEAPLMPIEDARAAAADLMAAIGGGGRRSA